MRCRGLLSAFALLTFACSGRHDPALVPSPSNTSPPESDSDPESLVVVHCTVHDYSDRPVANARVSATFQGTTTSLETDASGRFTAHVSPGTWLSVHKDDMMGSVEVGEASVQTIVITMAQMPM